MRAIAALPLRRRRDAALAAEEAPRLDERPGRDVERPSVSRVQAAQRGEQLEQLVPPRRPVRPRRSRSVATPRSGRGRRSSGLRVVDQVERVLGGGDGVGGVPTGMATSNVVAIARRRDADERELAGRGVRLVRQRRSEQECRGASRSDEWRTVERVDRRTSEARLWCFDSDGSTLAELSTHTVTFRSSGRGSSGRGAWCCARRPGRSSAPRRRRRWWRRPG